MIIIGKDSFLNNTKIRIRGNNNTIEIGKRCHIGKECSFWVEGNNITIKLGNENTFTRMVHFCAQENYQEIIVGNDCMFSNTIIVRTSDSHPIFSENGERLNNPRSVVIGNHVWIAPGSKIFKGSIIHDGSVIGSNSLVTKEIPPKSLAVGQPAKVIKNNIVWTRDELF